MLHIFETIGNCSRNLFIRQSISSANSSTSIKEQHCIVNKEEEKAEKLFEYLPTEVQHKILTNLNYDDLFTFKQTNRHFYEFIKKYEECFAHKKFDMLCFTTQFLIKIKLSSCSNEGPPFNKEIQTVDFSLSDQLQKEWQIALDKFIKVFLLNLPEIVLIGDTTGVLPLENSIVEPLLVLYEGQKDKKFHLKVPLHPRTIEEMKMVRYWLEQIFLCVFDIVEFKYFIFNPEMINLLFDNDEIVNLKINCRFAFISYNTQSNDVWKFNFDLLVIGEGLIMDFNKIKLTDKDRNILFQLLLNEGHRIPLIVLHKFNVNQIVIYNNLVKLLERSKDLSKIVTTIKFLNCEEWTASKLIVKGVKIDENDEKKLYKITNIHDKKIVFNILWVFDENGWHDDSLEAILIIKMK